MIYYIDYDKCYGGKKESLGKTNKISLINISKEDLTSAEQAPLTSNKNIPSKKYLGTSYTLELGFRPFHDVLVNVIDFYTSKTNIILSYNDYPELQFAEILDLKGIKYSGKYSKKHISSTLGTQLTISPGAQPPFFSDSDFETFEDIYIDSTTGEGISYEEAKNKIDRQKNFTPAYGILNLANDYPKYKFTKYSDYLSVEVEFVSKMLCCYPTSWLIVPTSYDKEFFDFDFASFSISYTAPNIEDEVETLVIGEEGSSNPYTTESFLFVNGNTYDGIDYTKYHAGSLIEEFYDGKNILEIKIPVANFELDNSGKIILEEGDECYVVRKAAEGYQHLFYNKNKQPQLFKVMFQKFNDNGMALQEIKLEPMQIVEDSGIYINDMNVITGINADFVSSTKIVNIPYKIKAYTINEIGDGFAEWNGTIEKIVLPFTIKKIGNSAFAYTYGIRAEIKLPEGLNIIGDNAFYASDISGDLIIPEGVVEIGYNAFGKCESLDGTLSIPSSYNFPKSGSSFNGCKNLSKIVIYSNKIETSSTIDEFEDTGDCPIYVLDSMVELFKERMPSNANRIKSLSEMYE